MERVEIFHVVSQRFIRGFGLAGLAAILSLGLAGKVRATYLDPDCAPSGDYLDRGWYYLLDEGQYYYLDGTQYNLLGGLGYLLGHPCYPKLYERDLDQAVGFTNRVNAGWFGVYGEQVPISEFYVLCCYFNAGDYLDRGQYYFLDKGQYYYLDKGQYNLLGGLGYSFGRPSYQIWCDWGYYQSVGQCATPEPSTILYLGLGVFGILALKRY